MLYNIPSARQIVIFVRSTKHCEMVYIFMHYTNNYERLTDFPGTGFFMMNWLRVFTFTVLVTISKHHRNSDAGKLFSLFNIRFK